MNNTTRLPNPSFLSLPERTRAAFETACSARDVETLVRWLNPDNKVLRAEWSGRSGVRLPAGKAASASVIRAFYVPVHLPSGRRVRVIARDSDPTARVHVVFLDNPDEDAFVRPEDLR